MDFLRRLGPQPEGDTTRAVAALPSRFASESPLRAAAVAAVWKPMNEDDALARIPGLPSPPAAIQASADSAGAHRALQAEAASPPAIELTDPRPFAIARPAEAAPAHREGRHESIAPRSTPRLEEQAMSVEGVRQVRHDRPSQLQHAVRAFLVGEASPVAPSPVRAQVVQPAAAAPMGVARTATPLSAAALAARATQAVEQRPVIHVTIDRIEVRAPASPERPPASAKPRAASPTVSLSDYLRARGPTQPRGAS